jgi:hypothetical protein
MEIGPDRGTAESVDQSLLYWYGGKSSPTTVDFLAKVVEGADEMYLAFSIHGAMRSISCLLRYL